MDIFTKKVGAYPTEPQITELESQGYTADEADAATQINKVPTAIGRLITRLTGKEVV